MKKCSDTSIFLGSSTQCMEPSSLSFWHTRLPFGLRSSGTALRRQFFRQVNACTLRSNYSLHKLTVIAGRSTMHAWVQRSVFGLTLQSNVSGRVTQASVQRSIIAPSCLKAVSGLHLSSVEACGASRTRASCCRSV